MHETGGPVVGGGAASHPASLKDRSFLKLEDFSSAEIQSLLDLAVKLKAAKRERREERRLLGCNIALIFEKSSTRTRAALEVAAFDQGAQVTYLDSAGSHLGGKESMKDTARVLGRMYDGIAYRGHGQSVVEELAAYAGVPVWNALTTEAHPTQSLADLLTIQEHCDKPFNEIVCCYLGDVGNNTCNSLAMGAAKMGLQLRLVAPRACWPDPNFFKSCQAVAAAAGGSLLLTEDLAPALVGADFIYTDVWVSMGEPASVWKTRIDALRPYQVTPEVMAATGNPKTRFLHCLPAIHNRETELGERLYRDFGLDGMEVTEPVLESEASIVFEQAENRLHTMKAIMVATLAG
ncbi:MAG: ornithine carbamoyltransferase [Kiloniellales bacterium]|nr:ornithine carbamoyltransferase [Kiloniellales bacterium]MDJ0982348.1 ornithine carbamoyltransferase [Kiloniellales bacterium]